MSTPTLDTNQQIRPELGDFSSIVCFKAMVVGIEEALGEKAAAIALIAAGRVRGRQVAAQLSLDKSNVSLADVASKLNTALGKDGTRLCIIDKIVEEGDLINVFCQETVCSSGEPQGSSRCLSFTLGAIQGALEHITQKRLRGKQIESVLRGGTHDVLQFQPLN
jgi:hypothetical protein